MERFIGWLVITGSIHSFTCVKIENQKLLFTPDSLIQVDIERLSCNLAVKLHNFRGPKVD